MAKSINLNDPTLSPEVRDFLVEADICSAEEDVCSSEARSDVDTGDGYLTPDEASASWGSLDKFQSQLVSRFHLFADFEEGQLVKVSTSAELTFTRDDFPFIDHRLWWYLVEAHKNPSTSLIFSRLAPSTDDPWKFIVPNYFLLDGSPAKRLKSLRKNVFDRIPPDLQITFFVELEGVVRQLAGRMGLVYSEPQASDVPVYDLQISLADFRKNPSLVKALDLNTGEEYNLSLDEKTLSKISASLPPDENGIVIIPLPRTLFGFAERVDQLSISRIDPLLNQPESSSPLYRLTSGKAGEGITLESRVNPIRDRALREAKAGMIAHQALAGAVFAMAGATRNAASNAVIASLPVNPPIGNPMEMPLEWRIVVPQVAGQVTASTGGTPSSLSGEGGSYWMSSSTTTSAGNLQTQTGPTTTAVPRSTQAIPELPGIAQRANTTRPLMPWEIEELTGASSFNSADVLISPVYRAIPSIPLPPPPPLPPGSLPHDPAILPGADDGQKVDLPEYNKDLVMEEPVADVEESEFPSAEELPEEPIGDPTPSPDEVMFLAAKRPTKTFTADEIISANHAIVKALEEAGWNKEQINQFASLFITEAETNADPELELESLPAVLETMQSLGFNVEQQNNLVMSMSHEGAWTLEMICQSLLSGVTGMRATHMKDDVIRDVVEKAVRFSISDGDHTLHENFARFFDGYINTLDHAAEADTAMIKAGFSSEQIDTIRNDVTEIVSDGEFDFDAVWTALLDAVTEMTSTGFTAEQQYEILHKSASFLGWEFLPEALVNLAETHFSLEQIYQLLCIAYPVNFSDSDSFLWTALKTLTRLDITPEDQIQLLILVGHQEQKLNNFTDALIRIVENYNLDRLQASHYLHIILETGLAPHQIFSLFEEMVGKNLSSAPEDAFGTLHAAFKAAQSAGLSSDQSFSFLERIVKKTGRKAHIVLKSVPRAFAAAQKSGLTPEQIVPFFGQILKKTRRCVGEALGNIPAALEAGSSPDQIVSLFLQIVEKTGENARSAFQALPAILRAASPASVEQITNSYLRLLDKLTDYNRQRVLELIANKADLFQKLGKDDFPSHFEFYATVFERWPRLGFGILEGLFEATEAGVIPQDINSVKQDLLNFIGQTNGFNPVIYQAYQAAADKEAFMAELKAVGQKIINDDFGLDDIRQVIAERGKDFLVGVIQMTSPTSGASFVKRGELVGLLDKMIEAGDRRGDVPSVWKRPLPPFEITQGRYDLKAGQVADPDKVKEILNGFRAHEGKEKIEEAKLVEALVTYLRAPKGQERASARAEVLKTLYQLAGQNDVLREKIDRIQDNDYAALVLLAQIFNDKDGVQKPLADALDKVPEEEFVGKEEKKRIAGDGMKISIIRSLKAAWRLPTENERLVQLGKILRVFDDGDIERVILTDPKMDEPLKEAVRQAMGEQAVLGKARVIAQILDEPRQFITQETAKYAYNQSATPVHIGLRAVKGPAFGLNGMTSGVCTATDIKLWKKPKFKLFAITDEDHGQVVGYIHVFETEIAGKKYITLPGINPSSEFMATVDTQKLYDGMMDQVIQYARLGGYAGIYIPTDATIHSNRAGIQKIIQNAGYPVITLDNPVNWNTLLNPYPFSEVYGVWEKEEKTPPAGPAPEDPLSGGESK